MNAIAVPYVGVDPKIGRVAPWAVVPNRVIVGLAYGMTLVRMPLTFGIVLTMRAHPGVALALGLLSVLSDNLDGRLEGLSGRHLPARALLDGTVDRLCTYAVLVWACALSAPMLLAFVSVLACRDLFSSCENLRFLIRRRTVVKAPAFHAVGSLAHIAFATSLVVTHSFAIGMIFACMDVAVAVTLGMDQHHRISIAADSMVNTDGGRLHLVRA